MADTTIPAFLPGDRVRTLSTDDVTPAGSLGTVTEHYPRRPGFLDGYGVRLDDDPTGLSAHYDTHEIEPAPAPADADLRTAVTNAVRHHMPTAATQPLTAARQIVTDVLGIITPALDDATQETDRG
jgi:hypothetical protein